MRQDQNAQTANSRGRFFVEVPFDSTRGVYMHYCDSSTGVSYPQRIPARPSTPTSTSMAGLGYHYVRGRHGGAPIDPRRSARREGVGPEDPSYGTPPSVSGSTTLLLSLALHVGLWSIVVHSCWTDPSRPRPGRSDLVHGFLCHCRQICGAMSCWNAAPWIAGAAKVRRGEVVCASSGLACFAPHTFVFLLPNLKSSQDFYSARKNAHN